MKTKIIFFGNGPLADFALEVLKEKFDIIFHARTKEDLKTVVALKTASPDAYGILASYGVLIKQNVLDLFEPTGILNIHPSKLPDLRGPSPIETAILRGDTEFSVSIMKLVKEMDAGPLYYQETVSLGPSAKKLEVYEKLAQLGASLLPADLKTLPTASPQPSEGVSYSKMLNVSMSKLTPAEKPAGALLNEIRAFENFPKSRFEFNKIDCIILDAHVKDNLDGVSPKIAPLCLQCSDGKYLIIDRLQPAGRKPMDAKSFVNGYLKNQ